MRFPRLALWVGFLLIWTAPLAAQPAPLPPTLTLNTLNAAQPLPGAVGVRHANDGSNRLFVIVRTGQIRIMSTDGTLEATAFLNLQANAPPLGFTTVGATGGDERGLLGLAFHPLYATNGRFYVYYLDASSNTVVTEYTVSGSDADVADPASARVILRVYQPFTNHNGGDIHFGADGYLYVGLGDGGSGNDPCNSGQSLTSGTMSTDPSCVADGSFTGTPPVDVPAGQATSRALLGKMLRIDVDSTDTPAGADLCGADPALRRYGIPSDNPFAGDAGSNAAACDEIYHYGLRNPFRFSFDRDTHDLIIGDVGQGTFEEVDLVSSGGGHNFGWRICEGFNARGSVTTDCPLASATDPILTYGRDLGISITGGFRYRGPYALLDGVYFYADAYFSTIFFGREDKGGWEGATWRTGQGTVVGFGEDEAGHLYLTTLAGLVKRFVLPAGLSVSKVATFLDDGPTPNVADAGDVISYAVTLINSGGEDLTGIEVFDTLNDGAPQLLDCPVTLANGTTVDCAAYSYTVTQADVDAGIALDNVVEATADAPGGVTLSATDTDSIAMVAPLPALSVAIDAVLDDANTSGVADAGETIDYTYEVTNSGNVTLESLTLTSGLGGSVCVPGTLAPGATADCGSQAYLVSQADIDAGVALVNVANATASADGDVVTADSVQVSTAVAAADPGLSLWIDATLTVDIDDDGLADVGDTVRYTFEAGNTGNVSLLAVTVAASLDGDVACEPATLLPGGTATCGPIDHIVAADDAVAGQITLSGIASATPPQSLPDVASTAVEATIAADRPPGIFADGFETAP